MTLELGQLAETVSVEASAPLVETRNSAIGGVIDNERIEELPLNGRNAADLIAIAGAVVSAGPSSSRSMQGGVGYSVAGGQAFGVAYLLDGAIHNNPYDNFNLPLPFPDALQEFRVETSAQNAQNGFHSGASVNAATKSGTNALHGNLFEFFRNHRFNATNPFNAVDPATGERRDDGLKRNQFGGTLGGPIVEDRLFFFGAYQGTKTDERPSEDVRFVPTAAMLAGDFTQLASAACNTRGAITLAAPFVGNQISPTLFSPASVRIAEKLPQTTDPCGRVGVTNPRSIDEKQSIGRIDFQMSQNHSIFGRYMATTYKFEPPYAESGNVLSTTIGGRDNLAQSVAIGDSMVLSNQVVNNVRFAFNRTAVHRTHTDFFGPNDVGVNSYSYLDDYMLVTVTSGFNLGGGTENDAIFHTNAYTFSDDLTVIRNAHQFGFGASVAFWDSLSRANVRSPGAYSFDGGVTGHGLADFLLGRPFLLQQSAPNTLDMTQKYVGLYGQDTWRLSPTMTLNYGVRWEPWFPQQHQNGAIYNFSIDRFHANTRSTVFPQAPPGFTYPGDEGFPNGKAGMYTEWPNIAPRVGLAWDPAGNGRTSVRTGYGMNSEFVNGQFFINTANAPPWGSEVRLQRPGIGTFDNPFAGTGVANPFPGDLRRQCAVLAKRSVHHASHGSHADAGAFVERQRAAAGWRQHGGLGQLHRQLHNQPVGRRDREPWRHSCRCLADRSVHAEHRDRTADVPQLFGGAARRAQGDHAGESGHRSLHRFPRLLHGPRHAEIQRDAALVSAPPIQRAQSDCQLHAVEMQRPSIRRGRHGERRKRLHDARLAAPSSS